MTNEELLQYRTKLVRDAANMEKPDRIPLASFFVTWKILDAGYKMSEALSDFNIMEKCVREHQEKYEFDMLNDLGIRNAYRLSCALGSDTYMVNDEAESISVKDIAIADPKDAPEIAANFNKYLWEKGMPAKFEWWGENTPLAKVQQVYGELMQFMGFSFKIGAIMKNEYGVAQRVAPNPMPAVNIENVLGYLFGIKGTAVMMRRDKANLHAVLDAMDATSFNMQIQMLNGMQKNEAFCFDGLHAMLAHNFMSTSQWEEFYWPWLKKILDVHAEKGTNILIFSEGNILRFKDYFQDYPKGMITMIPENDDVFEFRKELPNVSIMGGMPCALLGHGTKEECLARAEKVVAELGTDGGLIFSQDKMGSYRNDANPENLKAVNDFVRSYKI